MRRSQTSALGSSISSNSVQQRRSIFAGNGDVHSSAAAASIGRSMLNRPRANANVDGVPTPQPFVASAAAPLRRSSESEQTLKSCLSSSSISSTMKRSKSSVNGFANEEFKMTRNVSFSHLQIREYEVTLGDNPSVSSGAPVSLGWNYDPNEKISKLPEVVECRRRSSNSFKLGDRERQRMLRLNPSVSEADLSRILNMIADVKFQRKQSLNEIHEEMERQEKIERSRAVLNELSFCV
ncbi:hypothetical protein ACHAWO_005932 [Cyclotella atomus]|uniref:Uncharacterized protein n=1 Tax=Cyclotella atomus TaxID=382360 RepID=A0ABD3N590_9STRA